MIYVYETNAALGYNQLAYLIRLDKSENGHKYLCIGVHNITNGDYSRGTMVKDLEDFYVNKSDKGLSDFLTLYNDDYFFNEYIKSLIESNLVYHKSKKLLRSEIDDLLHSVELNKLTLCKIYAFIKKIIKP